MMHWFHCITIPQKKRFMILREFCHFSRQNDKIRMPLFKYCDSCSGSAEKAAARQGRFCRAVFSCQFEIYPSHKIVISRKYPVINCKFYITSLCILSESTPINLCDMPELIGVFLCILALTAIPICIPSIHRKNDKVILQRSLYNERETSKP